MERDGTYHFSRIETQNHCYGSEGVVDSRGAAYERSLVVPFLLKMRIAFSLATTTVPAPSSASLAAFHIKVPLFTACCDC